MSKKEMGNEIRNTYYRTVSVSLLVTAVLLSIFWFSAVEDRLPASAVRVGEQPASQALTIDDIIRMRRQLSAAQATENSDIYRLELRRLAEHKIQARRNDLEIQRQKAEIDQLIAVRNAEIELVRHKNLLAEAERSRKSRERIAVAITEKMLAAENEELELVKREKKRIVVESLISIQEGGAVELNKLSGQRLAESLSRTDAQHTSASF